MKTKDDQPADGRISDLTPGHAAPETRRVSAVDPPKRHQSWFSSYNEEWEAFIEEHAIQKNRPGINNDEPESLPRVWNCPHT